MIMNEMGVMIIIILIDLLGLIIIMILVYEQMIQLFFDGDHDGIGQIIEMKCELLF